MTTVNVFNNNITDSMYEFDTVTLTNELLNLNNNTIDGTVTAMTDTTITTTDIIWQSNTVTRSGIDATNGGITIDKKFLGDDNTITGDMINSDDTDLVLNYLILQIVQSQEVCLLWIQQLSQYQINQMFIDVR